MLQNLFSANSLSQTLRQAAVTSPEYKKIPLRPAAKQRFSKVSSRKGLNLSFQISSHRVTFSGRWSCIPYRSAEVLRA